MEKYTITLSEFTSIHYPEACPGCLSSELREVLRVHTDVSIPGIVSVDISKGWPICRNCAEFDRKKNKLSRNYLALGAALCLAWVCLVLYLGDTLGVLSLTQGLLMFGPGSVMVAIIAKYLYSCHCAKQARKMGLSTWRQPIKLLRYGKTAFKSTGFIKFICYHEGFAFRFMQLNEGNGNLKIKPVLDIDPYIPEEDE